MKQQKKYYLNLNNKIAQCYFQGIGELIQSKQNNISIILKSIKKYNEQEKI